MKLSYLILRILIVTAVLATSTMPVYGYVTQLKQSIVPLDCTKQVVQNGVEVEVILTPEDCDALLHPKPEQPEKPPVVDNTNSEGDTPDSTDIHAPNTGWRRQFTDAVYEAGLVPLAVVCATILSVLVIRKRYAKK